MDRIKERLSSLRVEADAAVERAETAEKKNKELEQLLLANEQDIKSLTHRNGLLEAELEKNESKITEFKHEKAAGENSQTTVEGLTRKVQILETDLENTEHRLQESASKIRELDTKAEHYERQIHRLEQERDDMEKKYEEAVKKYQASQTELDALVRNLDSL